MDLLNVEFKRKFSLTLYKNLKLRLAEMSFSKDFVNDTRGDLYPVLGRSEDASECVTEHLYRIDGGRVERFFCRFFPYATYRLTARVDDGTAGFVFRLPNAEAALEVCRATDAECGAVLRFSSGEVREELPLPAAECGTVALCVSLRPRAFDVYLVKNGKDAFFRTFVSEAFRDSNLERIFENGEVALALSGRVTVSEVTSCIDSGVSLADPRPIRYENGEVMVESGRVFLTASIRMQEETFEGVFSWIPGTAEFDLVGALFFDCGDGRWCGDVASSILYHRAEGKWLLWVCAFSHGHVLAHAAFCGDPRFGVNVIDVTVMEKAPLGAPISDFRGFTGDEDPDFFYDERAGVWHMAICRVDPATKRYRYVFFESEHPFDGYRFVGAGMDGAETGGSFVRVNGELYFLCGNDFHATSDYRIYHRGGMTPARFDRPDGGFRGWGTLMPVRMGTRTRYFWLTFDRHKGSGYNWSYGNLYCFEGGLT